MAANLMDLVRELKTLNARKKAGEALTPDELKRRKELKTYLKTALAEQQAGQQPSAPPPAAAPAPAAAPPPAAAAPTPTPPPMPAATPPPQPAAPAPMMGKAKKSKLPEEPKAKKDYSNQFNIDAGGLLDAASKSEAVNALDERKAHASRAELSEAEAKADRAIKANKSRPKAETAEEIQQQFQEIKSESEYTASESYFQLDDYFGGFQEEGFEYVDHVQEAKLDVKPIDPREIELHKAGIVTDPSAPGAMDVTLPPGLAFLDDFPALYRNGVLVSPDDEVEPDEDDPNLLIPGKRKVTIHLLAGGVKRGVVRRLSREDLGFKLEPVGAGQVEELSIMQIKAMFIHKQSKAAPPQASGRNITVTFQDRKRVAGASDDYQPGVPTFTIVPPPGRGQFERILINSQAVHSVA